MLAALQEEDEQGENLLDAARRLAKAIGDLLNAAQPGGAEVIILKTLLLFSLLNVQNCQVERV